MVQILGSIILNEQLTAGTNAEVSLIFTGDERWADYAIDVDIDLYSPNNYCEMIIIARASDKGYVSYQTCGYCCQSLRLVTNEGVTALADAGTGDLEGSHHIRLECYKDMYTVYADGARVMRVQDGTLSSGRVGLGNRQSFGTSSFDNFKVSALE